MTRFRATFGIYMDSGPAVPVKKQAIEKLGLNVGENAYASFKAIAVLEFNSKDEKNLGICQNRIVQVVHSRRIHKKSSNLSQTPFQNDQSDKR